MGHELSVPYELTTPDGGRAVFQDSTDPDFVGYLREISGLESADTRTSVEDRPGEDGSNFGDFLHGPRIVTFDGFIQTGLTAEERNVKISKLTRATRAMRSDGTLRWTESGRDETMISFRRQQRPVISNRLPKNFLVALIAKDPRIVGTTEQTLVIPITGSAQGSGFSFPFSFPLAFQAGSTPAGQNFVLNEGDGPARVRLKVEGPIVNPVIRNETTGQELRLIYTLGAAEYLLLDSSDHSILLDGTSTRYGALDFEDSEWWDLDPGSNDIRLFSTSYSNPAALTVYWRSTWL